MTGISTGLKLAQISSPQPANTPSLLSGGPITIVTGARSELMCAPDSLRFTADLSLATFDTPAPVAPAIYDARMHELIYVWDFDDAADGQWAAPENTLGFYKQRNFAKGPNVSHVYRQPGMYSVTLTVTEPLSGKVSTTSIDITVINPDVVYAGQNTICVNNVGDSDFTLAPAGSKKIYRDELDFSDGTWFSGEYAGNGTPPKRWLFKRGSAYTETRINFGSYGWKGIMFGAYGNPNDPKPILNCKNTGGHPVSYAFTANGNFGDPAETNDIRFSEVQVLGNFDPVTEKTNADVNSHALHGLRLVTRANVIISQCEFSGFMYSAISFESGTDLLRANLHIDDFIMTRFGGQYPIFFGQNTHSQTSFDITGSRLVQVSDAIDDNGVRAPIRVQHAQHVYVAGTDFYHTDRLQACLKALETPYQDGCTVNIHGNAFEGGLNQIVVCGNATQGLARSSVHNVVIDSNIGLGNYNTSEFIRAKGTGITARNNLYNQPDTAEINTRLAGFMTLEQIGSFDTGIVGAAPIRVYNNTLRTERSASHDGSPATIISPSSTYAGFTDVSEMNNIVHAPNETVPQVGAAPLSTVVLFTPRCVGHRDATTLVRDVSRATPADAMKENAPQVGSAALGAVLTGDVSYQDIQMQPRPEPPSIGAWEAD